MEIVEIFQFLSSLSVRICFIHFIF